MATEKTHKPKSGKSDLTESDDQTPKCRPRASVWRPLFLRKFAEFGNVSRAAEVAGVRPSAAYYARNTCQEFSDAFAEAEIDAQAAIEDKVHSDAENNVENAKWILSRRWPEKWGERRNVSVSGKGKDGEIVHSLRITGVDVSKLLGEDDESDSDS